MDDTLTGPSRGRSQGGRGDGSPRQTGTLGSRRPVGAARGPAGASGKAASGLAGRDYDRPGRAPTAPRTPFVLLVLGLLGGGLVCLLVINTTLGDASFKISQLQQTGTTLAQQEQTLQREVSTLAAPAQVERQAYQLGMRPQSRVCFLEVGKTARRGRSRTGPCP